MQHPPRITPSVEGEEGPCATPGNRHIPQGQATNLRVQALSSSRVEHLSNASDLRLPPPLIVVIDDSFAIRTILETLLGNLGYLVKTFADSLEALRWFTTSQQRIPQLILLEMDMPRLGGYALTRLLKTKAALAQTTIVLMSRRDGMMDRLQGRLVGATDYLLKPFSIEVLMGSVQQYLGKAPQACGEQRIAQARPSALSVSFLEKEGEARKRAVHSKTHPQSERGC